MTRIPAESGGGVRITTRRDRRHVVRIGDETTVLTDEQLAMLGRVAIGRGVSDAE